MAWVAYGSMSQDVLMMSPGNDYGWTTLEYSVINLTNACSA